MASEFRQACAVLLSVLLVACCVLVLKRKSQRERKRLPPGPTPWPIVGNMFQISPKLHQSFGELAKKYGPLVFAKLGSMKVLVACNAELAKAIFQSQDSQFCSRPQSLQSVQIIAHDGDAFSARPHDDKWRQLKKIIVTELLSTKRLAAFKSMRTKQMLSMVRLINEESEKGNAIPIRKMLFRCFSNILTSIVTNKAYFEPESSIQECRQLFGTVSLAVRLFGAFNPGDYFPFLKPFDVLGVERKSRICNKQFVHFFQKIIDEHREKRDERSASYVQDFVDILLSCPGFEERKSLPDRILIAVLQDMLMAGTDTTSTTTEWAVAELLRNPEIRRKAQEELDCVVGRERLVTEEDIPKLTYLNAIMRENFRLHPVLPIGVPHVSPKGGCELAGYYIPEDTTVLVNLWAIGRDPESWERPDEFDPERFLGTNPRDVKGRDFELIPFGSGRRMCVGYNLGLILTHLTVAHLLHCFNWSLPDGQSPESLKFEEECSSFSAGLQVPLDLTTSPRLPPAVYC